MKSIFHNPDNKEILHSNVLGLCALTKIELRAKELKPQNLNQMQLQNLDQVSAIIAGAYK